MSRNDADAEAVVPVPGGTLDWRSADGGAIEFALDATRPDYVYMVCQTTYWFRRKWSAEHLKRHIEKNMCWDRAPYRIDTKAAAKIACEYHYATGVWKPS